MGIHIAPGASGMKRVWNGKVREASKERNIKLKEVGRLGEQLCSNIPVLQKLCLCIWNALSNWVLAEDELKLLVNNRMLVRTDETEE